MAKQRRGEIPLAAIPARGKKGNGKNYPLQFRQRSAVPGRVHKGAGNRPGLGVARLEGQAL
jgi:hypothetical protein